MAFLYSHVLSKRIFFRLHLILDYSEILSFSSSTVRDDLTSGGRLHSLTEAVDFCSFSFARLVCSLHNESYFWFRGRIA